MMRCFIRATVFIIALVLLLVVVVIPAQASEAGWLLGISRGAPSEYDTRATHPGAMLRPSPTVGGDKLPLSISTPRNPEDPVEYGRSEVVPLSTNDAERTEDASLVCLALVGGVALLAGGVWLRRLRRMLP